MGTLVALLLLVAVAYVSGTDVGEELAMKKRFDMSNDEYEVEEVTPSKSKRGIAISDASDESGHNEEQENGSEGNEEVKAQKRFDIYKKFDPFQKRFDIYKKFDPFQKRFDIYKRFDPFQKRFDLYKRFDPFQKRFDIYKRFDPFQKRFDLYKRFDPFSKRFDPLYKRFDPFFKRFDPYMKKRFDREETVRNLIRSLSQSKRNIMMDPRAFNIGFGR